MLEMENNQTIHQLVIYGQSDEEMFTVGTNVMFDGERAKIDEIIEDGEFFTIYVRDYKDSKVYPFAKFRNPNVAVYFRKPTK